MSERIPLTNSTDTARAPATARRPLYRTVLSLAVAALVAAWLPFTVFYVTALHRPPAQVAFVTNSHGQSVVTTRTSGGQTIRTAVGATGGQQTQTLQPVTTHAS
jgi:hypothetical protein